MSKRTTLPALLLGLLLVAAAADAQAPSGPIEQSVRLRLGSFRPEGNSQYWHDKAVDFNGKASDLEDAIGGIDYQVALNPHLALLFSGSSYQGQNDQSYRNFTDSRGGEVSHTTTLDIASLTAGLVFHLAGPNAPFRPYLGGGGGVYAYRLEEDGRFIDFNPPPPTVFRADSVAEGKAYGYYWLAGFEVPVGRSWGFFAEGRWHQVDDELGDDFAGFGKIDLSGRDVSAGVSYRF
jgi:opacity protein-like surface antigen